MKRCYLLLGGNLGNREDNLLRAAKMIENGCGEIVRSSSIYETEPWGKGDQPPFLNQAIEIETFLRPMDLMKRILAIERSMGRERKEKYGPRIIDIDILLFGDEQYDDPFLKIPHPEMQNRRFVLVPLSEIAGDALHPILKKKVSRLLEECPDKLHVRKTSM